MGGKGYDEKSIRALLEALEVSEIRKPAQVYRREVFRKYGILGSRYDSVFTAITYKMYRLLGVLDRAVMNVLGISSSDYYGLDPLLRQSLRLAAYLAQFDEVRDRRLVHSFFKYGLKVIAERHGWRDARKVHKVFRVLVKKPWSPSSDEERLMVKYLVPVEFLELLSGIVPREKLEALLKSLNSPPVHGVRVNTLKADPEEVLSAMTRSGLKAELSSRVPGVIRYVGPFNDTLQVMIEKGLIVPQEEPSALAAHLLEPGSGELIVDLCAAPGGKATHLAELSRLKARIVAFDIHWDRIRRMAELVRATGTDASISIVKADALRAPKIVGSNKADKVLLDPPCSTSGTLHKNVDARWRMGRDRISELVDQQKRLIEAAIKILRPGGRLLYTVCSLFPDEGEHVVKWALERFPVRLVPLSGPYSESPLLRGTVRSWPHRHGVSGFFYALLEKTDYT